MPLMILALATAAAAAGPTERLNKAVAIFDEVCLRAFPDDKAVDAAMDARGALPLSAEQAKVTLVDDPGRGWSIRDGDYQMLVFLELPPYHACSIRWPMPNDAYDLAPYRAVITPFQAARPGFLPIRPMEADQGPIHIHGVGEQRRLPGGGAEAFYVIDQRISDPARRANGETGVMLRLVRQVKEPK